MSEAISTVSIDPHGRFLVDAEPFFPVGLYSVPQEESFHELRRAGFNCVHSYEFERMLFLNLQSRQYAIREFDGLGDEPAARYLDAAADNDLMVLMGFNRPGGVAQEVLSQNGRQQVRRRVELLRHHRALLGWYVFDEPDGQRLSAQRVDENRRIVESLDPAHPTMTVLCVPDKFSEYAASSEVLMNDPYPVPREPLRVVGRNLEHLKQTVGPQRATLAVLQAFDWKSYDWTAEGTRAPTIQELRCMCYQAIVSNVSGILFFNYYNEIHSNRATDNPQGWAALSHMGQELQSLMPALLAAPSHEMQFTGEVQATFRKVGSETWVLTVNPETRPSRVTFALPNKVTNALIYNCFNDPARFEATGQFELEIEPYGVRALRVQPPPTNG